MSPRSLRPWDDDPRHGTLNGYSTLGCRCADCREVMVAYVRQWQRDHARHCTQCSKRLAYATRGDLCRECFEAANGYPKGCPSASAYNHGCRCQPCRDIVAARMRKSRANRANA